MSRKIFVYDPTVNDPLNKFRGVGRYLQILKENLSKDTIFTDDLKRIKTDSVFVNPFFNFLKSPLSVRRIAKKQVAVIHDLIPLKYPNHFPTGIKGKINIFLNQLALNNYDLIVTDSKASKMDIIEILNINENKLKVIYPCLTKIFTITNNQFPISKKISNFKFQISNYCLYVGDATWNKNLVNLAKAIKIINVTCVFIGKVFNTQLREHINSLNDKWQIELKNFLQETKEDKRFILAGFVPDEKLIKFYKQAACNILVSRDEGFGFSYLEAASQGCPSILSDISVLREISNNQGAIFVNPDNPNSIADAVGEIYFNKAKKSSLSLAVKDRTKYFEEKKFRKSWFDIIY